MFKNSLAGGAMLALMLANNALAEVLRDPTQPLEYRATTVRPSLELNSILIGNGRRIAVINGQEVAETQRLGDAVVIRILPNQVVLRRDGEDIVLTLHNRITKNAS